MMKSFRPWRVDEAWLLPPSVQDFVPPDHPAHLVRDIVRDELDLAAVLSAYTDARGFPPYHPGMMVALLLYAYSQSVYSSRRIARCCEERLDFQAITALNRPDYRTKRRFVEEGLEAALSEQPRPGGARKLSGRDEVPVPTKSPLVSDMMAPPVGRVLLAFLV